MGPWEDNGHNQFSSTWAWMAMAVGDAIGRIEPQSSLGIINRLQLQHLITQSRISYNPTQLFPSQPQMQSQSIIFITTLLRPLGDFNLPCLVSVIKISPL